MPAVRVRIDRFVDGAQPGWVACDLADAWGRSQTFVEKVPIVTTQSLDENSEYPCVGQIGCQVVRRWRDDVGRELVTIDTERPCDVESIDGQTRFDVLAEQLIESSE